jgi:hypothetical protein
MRKRSQDDISSPSHHNLSSQPASALNTPNSSSHGPGPSNELLSPVEEHDQHYGSHAKRPRNFIATVVFLFTLSGVFRADQ